MTGIDVSQVAQVNSSTSPRPESQVDTVRADGAGKGDLLRTHWPELSGLITVDFGSISSSPSPISRGSPLLGWVSRSFCDDRVNRDRGRSARPGGSGVGGNIRVRA